MIIGSSNQPIKAITRRTRWVMMMHPSGPTVLPNPMYPKITGVVAVQTLPVPVQEHFSARWSYANWGVLQAVLQVSSLWNQVEWCYYVGTGSRMGATIMIPNFVTNIWVAKKPVHMKTNAGSKVVTLKEDIAGFSTAHYDPTQVANIFGFAQSADKYQVTYNSSVEVAFLAFWFTLKTWSSNLSVLLRVFMLWSP